MALALALSACAQQNSPVQGVLAQSGDFGVAEFATIKGIDPILLDGGATRFDIAFGEFALSVLSKERPGAVAVWGETTRSFGNALAGELEEYIRGLSCVYTVVPQGDFISGAVADVVREFGSDDESIVFGPGIPFDDEDGRFQPVRRPPATGPVDVSVVSNCLLDVYLGDLVRIVQTPENMLILPQRTRNRLTVD